MQTRTQQLKEPPMWLDKPLPSNVNAENIVLGATLLDNGQITAAAEKLLPEDFYNPTNRVIFSAMVKLFAENKRIEPIAIIEELKAVGRQETIGTFSGLINGLPHFTDISHYVDVIKKKATARNLIKTCNLVTATVLEESEPIEDVIDKAEQTIYELRQNEKKESVSALGDVIVKSYNEAVENAKSDKQTLGLNTGFRDLDEITAGFQKTDFIIIAARPSMGKSSLVLDMAQGVTKLEPDAVCAVFSLEMSKTQCAERMICSDAKVDSTKYRLGKLSQTEWQKVAESAAKISERRIFVDDTPAITPLELKAKARQIAVKQKRLDLIVVDYLQLMRGVSKTESRQQEVSEISRELKAIAKDLQVPLIALSQLSRACEARQDKRPIMSDLRESGGLEQDADFVGFIYRDEYYHPSEENAGVAELIIRKHRHGRTDTVKLGFIKQFAKFVNYHNT